MKICVVDHGQFIPIAEALGRLGHDVFYTSPAERAMPVMREDVIGDGFDTFTRVDSLWTIKKDCDLFVFPDLGFAPEQLELLDQKKLVWGARRSDSLESNRGKFLKTLDKLEMEVPPHHICRGMTELRSYLKDKENKYVKISKWRGDFETFPWISWEDSNGALDYYSVVFGPNKDDVVFYVFDHIEAVIEDGIDTYCIDGKFPSLVLRGPENKDKSFIGSMTWWEDLPDWLRSVNEEFSPALSDYRQFFSTEVRKTDKTRFFIDSTCRAPSPPHQLECKLFGNLDDIFKAGAEGVCIDPVEMAPFGVQAVLRLEREKDGWGVATIPDAIREHVMPMYCQQRGDTLCFPESPVGDMAGWLTASGESIEAAITELKGYVEQLPRTLHCEFDSLAELLANIHDAQEKGMEFTDKPIPEPETIYE